MKPHIEWDGVTRLREHFTTIPKGVSLKEGDSIRLKVYAHGPLLDDATFELTFELAQAAEGQKEKP